MAPQWVLRSPPAPQAFLDSCSGLHPVIAQGLWSRGLHDTEEVERYLDPQFARDTHDPFLFRDMERSVERIARAIEQQELIIIHGDYDADGVMGATILSTILRALGAHYDVYLPDRQRDGYGFHRAHVDAASDRGVRLIITTDCGITAIDAIGHAQSLGIDVIVTDHHQIGEALPKATAIIHPFVDGESYPDKGLTGGGCAFKVLQSLVRSPHPVLVRAREAYERQHPEMSWEGFEKWQLDLAAIATIADCGLLKGENRALVRWGMVVLEKSLRPGLRALMSFMRNPSPLTAEAVAFFLAPRINAAGRMYHASLAYELLMEENEGRAQALAQKLDEANSKRREITVATEQEIFKCLQGQESDAPIVLGDARWAIGIVGLLAGRIYDRTGIPTFLLTMVDGRWVGSGRAGASDNCIAMLKACEAVLERYGGHEQACGFTLRSGREPTEFREMLTSVFEKLGRTEEVGKRYLVDADLALHECHREVLEQLRQCEPFGAGNEPFVFRAVNHRLVRLTPIGGVGNVRVELERGRERVSAVGFGLAQKIQTMPIGTIVDCLYTVRQEQWNGANRTSFHLKDIVAV